MKPLGPIKAKHVIIVFLVAFFPWLPGFPLRLWFPSMPLSFVLDANQAMEYALVAFSLVLLTGWVGQISLGQAAFVGVGAFTTGLIVRHLGIPFPVNLPLAALITAGVAALLGAVALRVRGLYLAVATLIFAWMCDAWLFPSSWLVGSGGSSSIHTRPIGRPDTYTFFDLNNKKVIYLVLVAVVAVTWYLLVNLRDSKTGRAFFAIRGSETAAVSLGIDVVRYKLLAFALSGAIAGIAGNLIMTETRTASPSAFQFTVSLFFLALVVIGGTTSLGGALAAGALFAGLAELFSRFPGLSGWLDEISFGLLLAVLLLYPGGLAAFGPAVARRVRAGFDRAWGWAKPRLMRAPAPVTATNGNGNGHSHADADSLELGGAWPVAPDAEVVEAPAPIPPGEEPVESNAGKRRWRLGYKVDRRSIDLLSLARGAPAELDPAIEEPPPPIELPPELVVPEWRTMSFGPYPLPPDRADRVPLLEADNVVVRFGGLTAVDNVSVSVREHEIVGLIGPNGAGKTTTFNAIAGLNNPAAGTIRLFGEDATRYPVHVRAQMGVGRTFQLIQLFPELTVFDNLLVATHIHNSTGLFSHLILTANAITAERDAYERVGLVIDLLGLGHVAERPVAGLPFGVLRQIEIARALVTGAPLLMLDEPASGLDNAETDEVMQLLRYVRSELGVSVLLIEHDVRMVVSVCDYIYVVNQGKPLAEGTAGTIQRDPEVIAAYLGQAEAEEATEPEPAGARR